MLNYQRVSPRCLLVARNSLAAEEDDVVDRFRPGTDGLGSQPFCSRHPWHEGLRLRSPLRVATTFWVAKDYDKYLPFLKIWHQLVLSLFWFWKRTAEIMQISQSNGVRAWGSWGQELFPSFSAALDNGTGAPGMSYHVMISHDIS